METTPATFDLNQAIQRWRTSLSQSPAFCRENLDELESHLRDSITNLTQRGLEFEEAFIIANRRMGSGAALGTEFGKINASGIWLNRALWMLVGIQGLGFIKSLVSAVSLGAATLGIRPIVSLGSVSAMPLYTGLLCGLVHLLAFAAALAVGWKLLRRKGPGAAAWLRKAQTSSTRLTVLVVAFLLLILLSPAIQMGNVIFFRQLSPSNAGQFLLGINYGTMSASLLESAMLIVLTLVLARRQLFAKTGG